MIGHSRTRVHRATQLVVIHFLLKFVEFGKQELVLDVEVLSFVQILVERIELRPALFQIVVGHCNNSFLQVCNAF